MLRWVAEEGLSLDTCSAGEIAVARSVGFPADRILEAVLAQPGLRLTGLHCHIGSKVSSRNVTPCVSRIWTSRQHGFPLPRLTIEPGRTIVGPAGITVYRVCAVKRGSRTFVAVDGGMSDNPRPALYGARYTARLVGRHSKTPRRPMTVVGRHCESGDVLAEVDEDLLRRDLG